MAGAKYISRILGPVSAGCDHEHYQSKVTLFFLAFLPQFAKPALGNVPLQIVTLGLLFQLATLVVFGGVSFLGGRLAEWFNASIRGQIILNRITACIFTALALLLIFSSR